MNANIAGVFYLVAGVLFILALRGLSSPEIEPARQSVRHGRDGDRRPDDAGAQSAGGDRGVGAGHPGACGRRRDRGDHRAACSDDEHAGAGRGVPFAGRHGRGAGGGGRALCAERFQHRHGRPYSRRESGRDVDRHGDRRHHLHRLGDRVPQAVRTHERRAYHAACPPRHQSRPRRPDRLARGLVRAERELYRVLAARASPRSRSAC